MGRLSRHQNSANYLSSAEFSQLNNYANQIRSGNYAAVTQYYHFLADRNYVYGDLALGVVEDNTLSGIIARNYAEQFADDLGININWQDLSRELALADFEQRQLLWNSYESKLWLGGQVVYDYHAEIFERFGLPKEAWTGSVFFETADGDVEALLRFDDFLDVADANFAEQGLEYLNLLNELKKEFLPSLSESPGQQVADAKAICKFLATMDRIAADTIIDLERVYDIEHSEEQRRSLESISALFDELGALDNVCFRAGTSIAMSDGSSKNIEEIKEGDKVLTFSELNPFSQLSSCSVRSVFTNTTSEWIVLSDAHGRETHITPNHRVLTQDGLFKAVGDLAAGVSGEVGLVGQDGKPLTVSYARVTLKPTSGSEGERTYNFEVDRDHTYIANGFRVHNECDPDVLAAYRKAKSAIDAARARMIRNEDRSAVDWAGLGNIIGSQLGKLIGRNSSEDFVASTILGALGANLAKQLSGGSGLVTSLGTAFHELIREGGVLQAFQGSGFGTASSLLTLEMADGLGLEGMGAEVFSAGFGSVMNKVITNVAFDGSRFAPDIARAFDGLNPFQGGFSEGGSGFWQQASVDGAGNVTPGGVGALAVSAIASYFGAKLGSYIVQPETQAGAVLSSLGSAVGSWAFSTVGVVGTSAAFANASWIVANAVLPGVGALIGFVIGAVIGNLFGAKPPPPPQADAETILNLSTGYYELGSINQRDGGNVELVRSMAETARDSLNGVISYVTNGSRFADVANLSSPTQVYGHTADQIWVRYAGGSKRNFDTADEAVEWATMEAIEDTKIIGGDLFMKRAILNSGAPSIMSLMGDFQIADDYRWFVQDEVAALRRGEDGGTVQAIIEKAYESLEGTDKTFYDQYQDRITRVMTAPKDEAGNWVDDGTAQTLSSSDRNWHDNQWWGGERIRDRIARISTSLNLPQVAVGWLITLQRAVEAGVASTSRSDFYGGFAGFADSLQILNLTDTPLTYEQIGLQREDPAADEELSVRYDSDGDGSVTASDDLLFVQDDMRAGGFRLSDNQIVTAMLATGRSAAIASVIHSGRQLVDSTFGYYPFGDGQPGDQRNNSSGADLIMDDGDGDDVHVDDWHREVWTVRYNAPEAGGGNSPPSEGGGGYGPGESGPGTRSETVTVIVSGGDDVFVTGSGNDTLRGRDGNDWLDGNGGNDSVVGDRGDDVLFGRTGSDTLNGGDGHDYISTGSGDDYNGAAGGFGGSGNDTLVGGGGRDSLRGGSGDDEIILADGNVAWSRYTGDSGHDILSFERRSSAVVVNLETDWYRKGTTWEDRNSAWRTVFGDQHYLGMEGLRGSTYDDRLTGDAAANTLQGIAGDDHLLGGNGNDTLEGGAGADTLNGGGGNDYASYASSTAAIWIDFTTNEAFGGHAEGDTFTYYSSGYNTIEHAIGSDFADTFKGQDWKTNYFYGGKGDDWFVATGGFDRFYGEEDFDTVDYSEFVTRVDIRMQNGYANNVSRGATLGVDLPNLASDHGDTLANGQTLRIGETMTSANGRYTLTLNEYGQIMLLDDGRLYWATPKQTNSHQYRLVQQTDGNMVVYRGSTAVYSSGQQSSGARLTLQDDGNLVVRSTSGAARWTRTSNTQHNVNADAPGTNVNTSQHRLYDIEHVVGSAFNDRIYGRSGKDDYFTGGKGNDSLYGYSGNDTYIYNRGDGYDRITETADGGGWDVLMLGEEISWGDLWLGAPINSGNTRYSHLDVRINGSTSERVYVSNSFDSSTGYNEGGIDAIDVSGTGAVYINDLTWVVNGSDSGTWVYGAWDKRDLLMGNDGNDRIFSNRSNGSNATNWEDNDNILIGGRGNDTIYASVGDDTYVYEAGDGQDLVNDKGGEDRIQFGAGIRAEDILFEVVGSDLYIGVRGADDGDDVRASQTTDRIRIQNGGYRSTMIEYVTAGGVDINLLTLDGVDWADASSGGGYDPRTGTYIPPVLFDLDGDGVAGLIGVDSSTIGVGASGTRMGWFGPGDGVLALDRNEDGVIDRAGEISFRSDLEGAETDMEGLVAYDTDGDGALTSADEGWSRFSVWQDLDQNGVSSEGELRTLDEVGVSSISLDLQATGSAYGGSADSIVLNTASASMSGGSTMTVFDTAFALEAALSADDLAGDLTFSAIGAADTGPVLIEPTDELRRSFNAIMVDLDGDGFDTYAVEQSVLGRDLNGDGIRDRIGWLTSEDGFLVTDANGDGQITVGEDLVETHRDLDSNRLLRGNVLQQIRRLSSDYMVWRDENQNGVGDEGELFTLQELEDQGIATDLYDRIREAQHPHSTSESPIQGVAIEWFEGRDERNHVDRGNGRGRGRGNGNANGFAQQRLDALRAYEVEQEQAAADGQAVSKPDPVLGTAPLTAAAADGAGGTAPAASQGGAPAAAQERAPLAPRPAYKPEHYDEAQQASRADGRDRTGISTGSSRWWMSDLRDRQTLGGRGEAGGLSALLAELDGERNRAADGSAAPQVMPQAEADALAENQRLLQAMAAFHGSSGAAGMRKVGAEEDRSDAMERLGVAPTGSITRGAFF